MKVYQIVLDGISIGTTLLEKSDPPMGVVFGTINFINIESGYAYFSKYCFENNIEAESYPEDKFISTRTIPKLSVLDENGKEIKGLGCYVGGMDTSGFDINIEGVPYPFYEEELPHHVKDYENRFG